MHNHKAILHSILHVQGILHVHSILHKEDRDQLLPWVQVQLTSFSLWRILWTCRIPWTCRILRRMALWVCLLWLVCAKGQKKARIIYLNSQSLVVKFIFTVHLTYDDLCDLIGHVSAFFGLLSNSKTIHKSD